MPFKQYLAKDVAKACELAHAFETKLIRGFSFYPPKGAKPEEYLDEAVDRIGQIAEACHRSDLTFGLEVEAKPRRPDGRTAGGNPPAGQPSRTRARFRRRQSDRAGAFPPPRVYAQWEAMKPGLGWVHIKDYRKVSGKVRGKHVDEHSLDNFVPADQGVGGHERILADLKTMLPTLSKKLERRGIPGVFLDLEPHVRGGGQFGGTSGPDGMGIALRSLCRVLDTAKIAYQSPRLRRSARGPWAVGPARPGPSVID